MQCSSNVIVALVRRTALRLVLGVPADDSVRDLCCKRHGLGGRLQGGRFNGACVALARRSVRGMVARVRGDLPECGGATNQFDLP
eukprot:12299357-Heterocapsa_arctica.AAC.1